MTRPMKITILDLGDYDPNFRESPWYVKPAFVGETFDVLPNKVYRGEKYYYQLMTTPHNMEVLNRLRDHMSQRLATKMAGGRLPNVYIEHKYGRPSGTTNGDFSFLLNDKEVWS